MKRKLITLCSLLLALAGVHLNAVPLGTAFTYQGRLDDAGQPANGTIPMVFRLWDDATAGINIGTPSFVSANVPVANGLFSIDLDFGPTAFSGDARWLEIRVNGTLMTTRQRVVPTPYAVYASTAGTVKNGGVQANQLGTAGATAVGQILTYNGSSPVWQTPGGPNLWSVNGNNDAYYNGGKVGVGTAGPSGRLTVATSDDTMPSFITAFDGRHAVIGTASEGVGLSYSTSTGAGYITALAPGVAWKDLVLQAKSLSFNISGQTPALSVLNNGNVGIGSDLNVNGHLTATSDLNVSGNVDIGNGAPTASLLNEFLVSGTFNFVTLQTQTRFVVKQNGNVGIGTTTPQAKFDVNGNINYGQLTKLDVADNFTATVRCGDFNIGGTSVPGRRPTPGRALVDFGSELHLNYASDWANTVIGGNNVSVCTLTIRGGCDLAEPFPMKEEQIEKGSVVVIDEEHSGRLKLSTRAYDRQVAGIVSGANGVNPGIALHQEGVIEGGQNVALSGRVYVQADASSSSIQPGDLLTTSDTPGHAMKVTDHAQAQGAIIGKAMSTLKEGKGMVLVLVSLQ